MPGTAGAPDPRMDQVQLRERTKNFATAVVRFCRSLPSEWDVRDMGRQLLRSGTSVAANYRACGRARSAKEFCSKLGLVVEEADESQLWLELLPEADPGVVDEAYRRLLAEARELTAIFTASYRTAKINLQKKKEVTKKARTNESARA
jgi:four helix bundle protein